jgi:hypothetical protein
LSSHGDGGCKQQLVNFVFLFRLLLLFLLLGGLLSCSLEVWRASDGGREAAKEERERRRRRQSDKCRLNGEGGGGGGGGGTGGDGEGGSALKNAGERDGGRARTGKRWKRRIRRKRRRPSGSTRSHSKRKEKPVAEQSVRERAAYVFADLAAAAGPAYGGGELGSLDRMLWRILNGSEEQTGAKEEQTFTPTDRLSTRPWRGQTGDGLALRTVTGWPGRGATSQFTYHWRKVHNFSLKRRRLATSMTPASKTLSYTVQSAS